jgi:hypothetical protein
MGNSKLLDVAIYLLVLVLAILPVVSDALTTANFSGTLGTITGVFTIFLAIGGLYYATKAM